MLKIYVRASDLLASLRSDKRGVVSFEYVIVAACVIAAVGVAFSNSSSGIGGALTGAITSVKSALTTAMGG